MFPCGWKDRVNKGSWAPKVGRTTGPSRWSYRFLVGRGGQIPPCCPGQALRAHHMGKSGVNNSRDREKHKLGVAWLYHPVQSLPPDPFCLWARPSTVHSLGISSPLSQRGSPTTQWSGLAHARHYFWLWSLAEVSKKNVSMLQDREGK